jgi:ABC-2 type transport system permease protein
MTTLALTHARFQLLETMRVPMALIGSAFFPAASMLFFVVPFAGDDPRGATLATASIVTFAVMTTNLFQYGAGIAEDRGQPWDPFTRSLPAGPGPRFLGRILAGLALTGISLIPVLIIGWLFTPATLTGTGAIAAVGALIVMAVPFTLLGLAIGYSMPAKAAIVTAQVLFLPLGFGGGLLSQPGNAPGFLEHLAPYLPTGGAARLMWAAVGDFPVEAGSVAALVGWIVVFAALAAWAYRRDEGRRFS